MSWISAPPYLLRGRWSTMDEYFSRERLAGYDTHALCNARVLLVGAGALGNNVVQCLALAGVGEIRCVDPDYIESSNLTRAPLFAHLRTRSGNRRSNKAKELALAALQLSYASSPVVRYAPSRLEGIGMGALQECDVVVAAVDSAAVRATIAEWTRLLGIPLVEAGFSGLRGNISAYRNIEADEPCYGCLNPSATPERVSCKTYAAAVAEVGRTPATQTIAALMGALVAEATIRFSHGDDSLAGHALSIDSSTWKTTAMKLSRDPACHCAHRRIDRMVEVAVAPTDRISAILDAFPDLKDPELLLPASYIASMPCVACGNRVRIAKPQWQMDGVPRCPACDPTGQSTQARAEVHDSIRRNAELSRMSCQRLGLTSRSIVELYDRDTQMSHWVQLGGSLDDLFVTRTRAEDADKTRYPATQEAMEQNETEETFRIL